MLLNGVPVFQKISCLWEAQKKPSHNLAKQRPSLAGGAGGYGVGGYGVGGYGVGGMGWVVWGGWLVGVDGG